VIASPDLDLRQLPSYRFPDTDEGRQVLRAGDQASRRPVVLLHELGGLAQATVDYAATLVDEGCVVHMPVIFGSAGQQSPLKGAVQLCWGRQLVLLRSDRRPKIADWLAGLCDEIQRLHRRPVVVIGMCATGGVVFSVLKEDSVGGGVAAQPSLPWRSRNSHPDIAALGSTTDDVEAAAGSKKPFVAMRYEKDGICPAGRLLQVERTFGQASVMSVPGDCHSTLVYDPNDAARERVLALLDQVFYSPD
jgi:dienelactone hydrolase